MRHSMRPRGTSNTCPPTAATEGSLLFCRDPQSYHHVQSVNPHLEVILAHDMAFHLDAYQLLNDQKLRQLAKPILEDKLHEVGLNERTVRQKLSIDLSRLDSESRFASPKSEADISHLFMLGTWPHEAPTAAWCFLKTISLASKITTDRLHVGIGSALLGKPCELRDNLSLSCSLSFGSITLSLRHCRLLRPDILPWLPCKAHPPPAWSVA